MHVYIYDSYVNDRKNQSIISKIETRITDLGLGGKIIRIGMFNSIYNAIENEINKGAKTIIAVGNNNIFNQVINSVAKFLTSTPKKNIPIGFIPVGKQNNEKAQFTGIPFNEEACDILSARRIDLLDLGKINNQYFLFEAKIPTKGTTIEIDKNFSIEIDKSGDIYIVNLPTINMPKEINSSAHDDCLELLININKSSFLLKDSGGQSVFNFKKLKIINNSFPITVDSSLKLPTPVEIEIAKEKINLIVGKNRKF